MGDDLALVFTNRLKAVANALGITRHQQLPEPPDHRSSASVWNGKLTSRHADTAGKLWDSISGEIDAGGYCPKRKRAKGYDLQAARNLLGARDDFLQLAKRQYEHQGDAAEAGISHPGKRKAGLGWPVLRHVKTKPFTAEWVLFAPFCPGTNSRLAASVPGLKCISEDGESSVFVAQHQEDITLRWFSWGGATWTFRTVAKFPDLCSLASERKNTYREILHGQHVLRQLTSQINGEIASLGHPDTICPTPIGYALSLMSIIESGWEEEFLPNALQALSCPNVILRNPETDADEAITESGDLRDGASPKELEILLHGVRAADLQEFSQPGFVHGYACWAGIAAHISEPMRPRMLESWIHFQQELQSLWWRLHSLSAWLSSGSTIPDGTGHLARVKIAVQKALRIGPTEPTAVRLFKEAVISTSRFRSVFEEFQQIQQETKGN